MRRIKRDGFTTLECVISLFIVSMIVFIITTSLHNNLNLLKKDYNNRNMLYLAKEIIEDERENIKNKEDIESYSKTQNMDKYTVITTLSNSSFYKCYNLKVKVLNGNKEINLNTYVTKKE